MSVATASQTVGGETPPAFATSLFGQTAREDLSRYDPRALAWLAERAWAHLAEPRSAGHTLVRLFDPEPADAQLGRITVIEIVNEDMPFLVDSTLAELADRRIEVRLVAHPILAVVRDLSGRFVSANLGHAGADAARESLIHVHVDRMSEAAQDDLATALQAVYTDVRAAVADWRAMRGRVRDALAAYPSAHLPLAMDEAAEATAFLEWLAADHFTFIGVREYKLHEPPGGIPSLEPVAGSGLGVLRDPKLNVLRRGSDLVTLNPEVLQFLHEPQALIITKASVRSRVHRRTHFDYVGIKTFAPDGQLAGELRLVGLFTADVYTTPTRAIPILRRKVADVVQRAALDPGSHSGRAALAVIETFPRDELFQIDAATLTAWVGEIARLSERPRLRVLTRADSFDRFVSLLVYIPRDRYDSAVRHRIGAALAAAYDGHVSLAQPYYPDGPLTRTHFIIGRRDGPTPVHARDAIETLVAGLVRTWNDGLDDALRDSGRLREDRPVFPAAYQDSFPAAEALAAIAHIDQLSPARPRVVVVAPGEDEMTNLQVFSLGQPMLLSDRVPTLENLGFRVISERTFPLHRSNAADAEAIYLHDMLLQPALGTPDIAARAPALEAALGALFRGDAENDNFNALVLQIGMGWRDVAILRALARYLRQTNAPFTHSYMGQTLRDNAEIAGQIVALFYARFDPRLDAAAREAGETTLVGQIDAGLKTVESLDEDRILRRLRNIVQAGLRTNFFQLDSDGQPRATLAIKLASRSVDDLPAPRPLYEITVYSPRVEGIHLRFGMVARGGIRWTDRPQDFRTEVLGLVKAQQVKNAVIVPVGAKGGFLPKRLPPSSEREAFMAEGVGAYRDFIGALLDVTDNLVDNALVPPPDTIRHDGDDPYLVVAADKGTATFSDIANGIATARGFWLGDAFASGGSAGYDHKKMGITARGAWESVKRHFREMDIDIQSTPFTVVGVGDMSGDVFGNGMLLSPEIKLVAAFDHRDIFLDPDPDLAKSLAERQRLFALPRSSWKDYDASLLSEGGGVFSRSAKSVALTPQVRTALGIDGETATPDQLMQAILRAKIDLLWFGGIGTYVRASTQTDAAVGDRANDSIRIPATDIRARVIGEGANLGMTQPARIEAALRAIRLNTDAIDNSAGVNTSDMEVNIKIALAIPMRDGRLDEPGRRALLQEMTDDVARLVLRNNYRQTLGLSLAERRGVEDIGFAQRLMQTLESVGRLDRIVEFLPDDASIAERRRVGAGLTRPELAVLNAYAKLALHDALLDSAVPDDPAFESELVGAFPPALEARFPDAIRGHRLRRDIIATRFANDIVDHGGPTVVIRIADETGADAPMLARAYGIVREAFALDELYAAIDALDAKIGGASQLDLYAAVQDLLLSRLVWFIRNVDLGGDLATLRARFRAGIADVAARMADSVPLASREAVLRRTATLSIAGVPADLAGRLAALGELQVAPDIVMVAERSGRGIDDVAATFFAADASFGLGTLTAAARGIAVADYYDRLALDRAIDSIELARRRLAADILAATPLAGPEAVEAWLTARGQDATRARSALASIVASGLTLSKATVAASLLGDLVKG